MFGNITIAFGNGRQLRFNLLYAHTLDLWCQKAANYELRSESRWALD